MPRDQPRDPDTGQFRPRDGTDNTTNKRTPRPRRAARRVRSLLFDGEVGKGDLLSLSIGVVIGIYLAHLPTLTGDVSTLVVSGGAAYRLLMRATKGDSGLAVIQYLDTLLGGAILGFVAVYAAHQGAPLDWLAHLAGSHTHA